MSFNSEKISIEFKKDYLKRFESLIPNKKATIMVRVAVIVFNWICEQKSKGRLICSCDKNRKIIEVLNYNEIKSFLNQSEDYKSKNNLWIYTPLAILLLLLGILIGIVVCSF